jgi:hypothetical protein
MTALKRFAARIMPYLFGKTEPDFLPSHHVSRYSQGDYVHHAVLGFNKEAQPDDHLAGYPERRFQEDYLAGFPLWRRIDMSHGWHLARPLRLPVDD